MTSNATSGAIQRNLRPTLVTSAGHAVEIEEPEEQSA